MTTQKSAFLPNYQTVRPSQEIRLKANEFLESRKNANNLVYIIKFLETNLQNNSSINSTLLTLEIIFVELLKRGEMITNGEMPGIDKNTEMVYRKWLLERYNETFSLMLHAIGNEKCSDSAQAAVSCMKLITAESKYSFNKNKSHNGFPYDRLQMLIKKIIKRKKSQDSVIEGFKEYSLYLDFVFHSWSILQNLVTRISFKNAHTAINFLKLMNILSVDKQLYNDSKFLFPPINTNIEQFYSYATVRKSMNTIFSYVLQHMCGISQDVHKEALIVLLERILPHYIKPIKLTDFLLDSVDCGGAIALLGLQGVFTLIQKHNISYPDLYEKLYSMFEPEIFHTKYKARLFFLSDIFLSSTHLPEALVAGFVKRLARLSLIAPPQDAIIIFQFIGNLLLRHPGLKRLICAEKIVEVNKDPFIMEERDPIKSEAVNSSLWEIALQQKNAIPMVAQAALFISQPLPTTEWDLSEILEEKEDDLFNSELVKKYKSFALSFPAPTSFFKMEKDKIEKHWKLF